MLQKLNMGSIQTLTALANFIVQAAMCVLWIGQNTGIDSRNLARTSLLLFSSLSSVPLAEKGLCQFYHMWLLVMCSPLEKIKCRWATDQIWSHIFCYYLLLFLFCRPKTVASQSIPRKVFCFSFSAKKKKKWNACLWNHLFLSCMHFSEDSFNFSLSQSWKSSCLLFQNCYHGQYR